MAINHDDRCSDEVGRLIRTAGFDPMKVGGINQSSRLEQAPLSREIALVTVGLSSVGPPPPLMTMKLLASAMLVGSGPKTTLPPSTSV